MGLLRGYAKKVEGVVTPGKSGVNRFCHFRIGGK